MRGDLERRGRLAAQQSLLRWTRFERILYVIPLRGIARRASSTLLAVAGIAGGVCILVTTLGIHVSVQDALSEYLNDMRRYDIDVQFIHPAAATLGEAVTALPEGRSVSHNVTVPVRVTTPWGAGETILTGVEQGQQSLHVRTLSGEAMQVEPGKLWIPKQLARKLRAEPGDPLKVEWVRSSRRRSVERVMQTAGVVEAAFGNVTYGEYHDVRRAFADRLFPESGYGAYVSVAPDCVEATKNRLDKAAGVAFVTTSALIRKQVDEQMRLMYAFIAILLSFGAVLAGSSIHSVASVAILERQRELATLLSLGFPLRTTAWLVALELGVLAVAGLAVGLPLGSALNTAYISSFQTDATAYRAFLPPWVHVVAALSVLGLVAFSSYLAMRRLRALDLSQATKAGE
jgi:putative ABC transport system permease protein